MAAVTDAKSAMEPHSLITEEHVRATLKMDKGNEAHLISWEIEDFTKKGDNFTTIVTSVMVKFSSKGEEQNVSYIVKLNAGFNIEDFDKIFIKEVGFYMNLAPELNCVLEAIGQCPLRIPKFFHFNQEKGHEMLFLEDLRPRGFKMAEYDKGNVTHFTLVIKELARLHASSILLQKKYPNEDLADRHDILKDYIMTDPNDNYFSKMLTRGNETTIAILKKVGGYEKVVNWIPKDKTSSQQILLDMLQRTPPFDVVCHGDAWTNNTLFRYDDKGDPVEVMLVDFQVCRMASLSTDLNYAMFISLTAEVRQANINIILETYFKTFMEITEAGGEDVPFTLQDLHQEYRNKNKIGLIFTMLSSPLMFPPDYDAINANNFFGGNTKEEQEEMLQKSLQHVDFNPCLRSRFLPTFDELDKAGIFD